MILGKGEGEARGERGKERGEIEETIEREEGVEERDAHTHIPRLNNLSSYWITL